MFFKRNRPDSERGNALIFIFIAIAMLGALTYAVSQSSEQSSDFADNTAQDEQIARMLTYSGTIAGALNQMVVAGAKGETLYSTLSVIAPSDGTFNTAPHGSKLFHPMGGGMNYVTSTGSPASSDTVATDYKINKGSIVTDVGQTNVTTGDILFTAKITSSAACARLNYLLRADGTIPVLTTVTFDSLFTTGSTVTISAGNCATCVGKSQICVSNTAGTAWGYYSALFPG